MILTYKYRIKDRNAAARLRAHARTVNFVWNYLCETQRKVESDRKAGRHPRWPSAYTLMRMTAGTSVDLNLHSHTINEICKAFAHSREAARHAPRFRASGGSRRSLGWIPFKEESIQVTDGAVTYWKRKYRFWQSRALGGAIKTGAFVEDARGRWYVTFQCDVQDRLPTGSGAVGIDLGLKAVATLSTGDTIPALQHYRRYEAALGKARRAGNKHRAQSIHAKIANARRHHLHVHSSKIAAENSLIVIGDVSASRLVKTKMAKSILDAGWTTLKDQLRYKASRHGATFIEVDEGFTTRTCSCCGSIPDSSPKGIGAIRIRAWVCTDCGETHDRDVNAARNILRLGLERQPLTGEMAA